MKKKVFIVDDHPVFCMGLSALINQEDDFEVIGYSETVLDALTRIPKIKPDVVTVDISLKGENGLVIVAELKKNHKNIPVLVLSMHPETIFAERAIKAGAKGYVMKQESPKIISEALRTILSKKIYVSAPINERFLNNISDCDGYFNEDSPLERLTVREMEILELIGRGLTTKEIALRIHVSPKTVGNHRENIKKKLNLQNINELMLYAARFTGL
ncbi:MAG: hypothetical protein A2277_02925 [Desulfobacterales bacterium RIFOXYA12_FULL_46_15]|nr:MAG: hypothetical protein A2097_11430 [Desulfobacula sp. GWF2_41_7]OGR27502.1 MAG: hypothetical protein A2277_02925 [Desulfobacterales bacterium RIFOXYA12_FULL_46_15]